MAVVQVSPGSGQSLAPRGPGAAAAAGRWPPCWVVRATGVQGPASWMVPYGAADTEPGGPARPPRPSPGAMPYSVGGFVGGSWAWRARRCSSGRRRPGGGGSGRAAAVRGPQATVTACLRGVPSPALGNAVFSCGGVSARAGRGPCVTHVLRVSVPVSLRSEAFPQSRGVTF